MALKIEWLEGAERDLDAEIDYVYREFGTNAAQTAYRRISDDVNLLATFPLIGSEYKEATYQGHEIRKLPIHQVTVFYSPQTDKVMILAIWNNSQNSADIQSHLAYLL